MAAKTKYHKLDISPFYIKNTLKMYEKSGGKINYEKD
jgi:hypothetical protein